MKHLNVKIRPIILSVELKNKEDGSTQSYCFWGGTWNDPGFFGVGGLIITTPGQPIVTTDSTGVYHLDHVGEERLQKRVGACLSWLCSSTSGEIPQPPEMFSVWDEKRFGDQAVCARISGESQHVVYNEKILRTAERYFRRYLPWAKEGEGEGEEILERHESTREAALAGFLHPASAPDDMEN